MYFAPTPNGFKITVLLEEAGIPYVLRPMDLAAGDQLDPSFLRISLTSSGNHLERSRREGGQT